MIPLSLRQRLLLLTLLPAALLTLLTAAYFTYAGYRALDLELRERGLATVRYLAPVAEYGVLAGNIESLQGPLQAAVQQPAVKAALVVGRNGRILAVSGRVSLAADVLRQPLKSPAIVSEEDQSLGFGAPIQRSVADIGELFDRPADESAAQQPVGQVFIELDTRPLKEAQFALLQRGLLILLVGLALAGLLARTIAEQVARPIVRLVEAVRRMQFGDYEVRVPADSNGEFGELERGFNDMATHISQAHGELQERIELATADLVYQARHDPLTDLVNRREFETRLSVAIDAANTGGLESAVLFIDLDRFKYVNDSAGHRAGDEVLRQISRQLQLRLREKDTLARVGGDEFAVLLPSTSLADAKRVADDLCVLVEHFRLPWEGQVFSVGASIGLVAVTAGVDSVTDVLQAGDESCYDAKHKGRNRVEVHAPLRAGLVVTDEGARVSQRLETALSMNELVWEVTPIVPIAAGADGRVLADLQGGLQDEQQRTLRGALLAELAERYGHAQAIDDAAVAAALQALEGTRYTSMDTPVLMLPLSTASLCDRNTGERLSKRFAETRLQPASLCLVLTEEAVIRHLPDAEYLCRSLHESGFSIALGDFGSWLTSLNHLHVVRPHFLRIHPNLTRDLSHGRSAGALVRAVQEVAADLGIATVAQSVDDAKTRDALHNLGVGYGFGRAMERTLPLGSWLTGDAVERRK